MTSWRDTVLSFSALPEVGALLLASDPAWIFARDGSRILWANPAGAARFGSARFAELRQKAWAPAHPLRRQIDSLVRSMPEKGTLARLHLVEAARAVPLACSLPPDTRRRREGRPRHGARRGRRSAVAGRARRLFLRRRRERIRRRRVRRHRGCGHRNGASPSTRMRALHRSRRRAASFAFTFWEAPLPNRRRLRFRMRQQLWRCRTLQAARRLRRFARTLGGTSAIRCARWNCPRHPFGKRSPPKRSSRKPSPSSRRRLRSPRPASPSPTPAAPKPVIALEPAKQQPSPAKTGAFPPIGRDSLAQPEPNPVRSVMAGRVARELSRKPVRFLWQTDAADRFLFVSPGLAQVVGPQRRDRRRALAGCRRRACGSTRQAASPALWASATPGAG